MDRIGKTGSNSTFIAIIGMQEKNCHRYANTVSYTSLQQRHRRIENLKRYKKERKKENAHRFYRLEYNLIESVVTHDKDIRHLYYCRTILLIILGDSILCR